MAKPILSFIICTYNEHSLIKRCLDSIIKQRMFNYTEILIIDGGSKDKTLEIIERYKKKYKNITLIKNKNKLPEGDGNGKWLGWKHAKGEFVAIVDQDNELQGNNWIKEMLKPLLNDKKIFGCACKLIVKEEDVIINRYISLIGTDPVMAYRSLDGIINLKKKRFIDKKDNLVLEIKENNLIITGGNCFIYRKKYLDNVGGYTQDTENIFKLVNKGYNSIAIPKKTYTHHQAVRGFVEYLKKKRKWAKAYALKKVEAKNNFSYIPKTKIERKEFILNFFFITIILPNLFIGIKKFIETREKAWILHGPIMFVTEIIYGIYFIFK